MQDKRGWVTLHADLVSEWAEDGATLVGSLGAYCTI